MSAFKSRVGNVYGTLTVVHDEPGKKFNGLCSDCGAVNSYWKASIKKGQKCLSCGVHGLVKSRLGELHGALKVTEDRGGQVMLCRCNLCGDKREYDKTSVWRHKVACENCQPSNRVKNRIGEVHGRLEVVEELGNARVACKCLDCGSTDDYHKYSLAHKGALCTSCKVRKRPPEPQVRDVYFQYVGRNKIRYYSCFCKVCDERLLLTGNEIYEHECEVKHG